MGDPQNYQQMVKSLSSFSVSFPEKFKICHTLLAFNKQVVVDFILKNYKKFPDFQDFQDLIFKLSLADKKLIEILIFFEQFELLATLKLEIQQIQEFLSCKVMVKLFITNHKQEKNKKKVFKNIVKILDSETRIGTSTMDREQDRELIRIVFTTKEILQELEFFLTNNQTTFVSEFFALLKKLASDLDFVAMVMDEFLKTKSKLSFKMFECLSKLNTAGTLRLMEIMQPYKVYDKLNENEKAYMQLVFYQNVENNTFLQTFIKLDFEIVDENLHRLDPDLDFAIQLLEFYAKSRQTLKLLEKLDHSVLLERLFLVEFQSQIAKMLPSQSFQILEYLKSKIQKQLQVSPQASKKLKSSGSESIPLQNQFNAYCSLIVYALTKAQVNASQKSVFETFLKSIYVDIIQPTISVKQRLYLTPLLQIHIVLMQLSNQYWMDFVTTKSILALFDGQLAKRDLQTLVELACFHLDLILFTNTFIDNVVDEGVLNDEGVQNLVAKVWDNYKDCKVIIQKHVTTLSPLSTKGKRRINADQIKSFVKKYIKQLGDNPQSELLTFAPFYEITEIKTCFLPEYFKRISKDCDSEISAYFSTMSKQISTSSHIDSFDGCKLTPTTAPPKLANLISVLDLIPNCYFTNQDREILQTFAYLLSIPHLLDRFVSCRRDVLLTLDNTTVLKNCLHSAVILEVTFKRACLDSRYSNFLQEICTSDWVFKSLVIKSLFKVVNLIKYNTATIEELAEKVLLKQELMKDLEVVDVILGYYESIKKPKDVKDFVDEGAVSSAKIMLKWGDDCKKYLMHIPTKELVQVLGDWLHRCTPKDYQDLVTFAMKFEDAEKSLRMILFLCQHAHVQLGRSLIYKNWSEIVLKICNIVKRGDVDIVKTGFEVLTYVAKDKSFSLSCAEVSLMMGSISSLECSSGIPTQVSFDLVYNLLYAIIKHRQVELMSLVPQFNQYLSSLLDCFVLDTKNKRGVDKLYKAHSLGLLTEDNVSYFKKVVRILDQMIGKPFAKYAPFMLARLLHLNLCNEVREEWRYACFACLDSCDDYGKMYLMKAVGNSLMAVYKGILSDYKGWKYKGKA